MPQPMDDAVILVVDDSPDTVSMLNDTLDNEGFSVLVALNGLQAISICKKITPDVILLDAMMPEMDGFETCRQIRKNPLLEAVPVIFMTGLDSQEKVEASFDSGASDYIQKPIRTAELIARINTHIKKSRELKASRELLDSNGLSLIAVQADGTISWTTPLAIKTLEKSGVKKIDLVSELPAFFCSFIDKASLDDEAFIPDSSPAVKVQLNEKRDDIFLLKITEEKPQIDEKSILAKEFSLTEREAEVLFWVSQGKSNKDLALILDISPRTVNKHLESVFSKMLVENRTSAANMALREIATHQRYSI